MNAQRILAKILALLIAGTIDPADMDVLGAHLSTCSEEHMDTLARVLGEAYASPAPCDYEVDDELSAEDIAFLNHAASALPMPGPRPRFGRNFPDSNVNVTRYAE